MHPSLDAIVVVPMFPHTLTSRPLVVPSASQHQSRHRRDARRRIRRSVAIRRSTSAFDPGDEVHIQQIRARAEAAVFARAQLLRSVSQQARLGVAPRRSGQVRVAIGRTTRSATSADGRCRSRRPDRRRRCVARRPRCASTTDRAPRSPVERDQLGEELARKSDRMTGRAAVHRHHDAGASLSTRMASMRRFQRAQRLGTDVRHVAEAEEQIVPIDHRPHAVCDARRHAEMRLIGRHDDRQLPTEAVADQCA